MPGPAPPNGTYFTAPPDSPGYGCFRLRGTANGEALYDNGHPPATKTQLYYRDTLQTPDGRWWHRLAEAPDNTNPNTTVWLFQDVTAGMAPYQIWYYQLSNSAAVLFFGKAQFIATAPAANPFVGCL